MDIYGEVLKRSKRRDSKSRRALIALRGFKSHLLRKVKGRQKSGPFYEYRNDRRNAQIGVCGGKSDEESNNDIDYCNKISKDGYYKPEEIVLMPIPGSGSKEFLFCVKMYCEM